MDLHLEPKHHQRKEVGLSLNLQETSLLQQFAYDYCHSVKVFVMLLSCPVSPGLSEMHSCQTDKYGVHIELFPNLTPLL